MSDRPANHRRPFSGRAVIPRKSSKGSPGGISTLIEWIPFGRTPRQRIALAGGALLLLAGLVWGLSALLAPPKVDYSKTWFSVEFTTDNQAHPVHLTLPGGKVGTFDLLMVENLSDKPLSLLAFSSRPRISGIPPDQVMTAWAQWIATSRQGIIVGPRSSWVLNPEDLERLPTIHGHTWIGVYFDDARPADSDRLPATVLGPAFRGRFRVTCCPSMLPEPQVFLPQVHRQELTTLLRQEIDATGKSSAQLSPLDLRLVTALSAADLR